MSPSYRGLSSASLRVVPIVNMSERERREGTVSTNRQFKFEISSPADFIAKPKMQNLTQDTKKHEGQFYSSIPAQILVAY